MEMKNRRRYLFVVAIIAAILLVIGIYIAYSFSKKTECLLDFECGWRITNCCTESAGAEWNCMNLKTYKEDCPDIVICPQVLSPKPQSACICSNGGCQKE